MARETSPAFQFYPKDLLSDLNFQAMSLPERGAYFTLLAICWLEQSLPTDTALLARIVGVPTSRFTKLWPAISRCFVEQNGTLVHPRLEQEREKQTSYRRRQSDRGAKGADQRWRKHASAIAEASSGHALAVTQASPSNAQAMLGDSSSSSTPVDPPNPPTGGLVQQATDTLRRAQSDIIASDELSERAAAYARQYPVIYAKAKHGASYRVMEARDWPAFLEMAERWPDERHWSNMVRLFLRKLDFAPKNQPGTPRQFLHLAPECDSLIRQATACA